MIKMGSSLTPNFYYKIKNKIDKFVVVYVEHPSSVSRQCPVPARIRDSGHRTGRPKPQLHLGRDRHDLHPDRPDRVRDEFPVHARQRSSEPSAENVLRGKRISRHPQVAARRFAGQMLPTILGHHRRKSGQRFVD